MSPKEFDDDASSTTSGATFSTSSSDTTLLTARIIQLENELGAALRENQIQRQRIESAESDLADEREMRAELAKANRALSDEVEELSKSLFMEASGMVEKEARARSVLEMRQKKLEAELAHTRDQLNTQTAQLTELRHKLQASGSALALEHPEGEGEDRKALSLKYYEDLFPEQKFCTGKRQALSGIACSWDVIIKDFPDMYFEQFSNFVELASAPAALPKVDAVKDKKKNPSVLITDEKILNHPFLRAIFECDVEPCFRFNPYRPVKSKSFLRKLVLSLLGNTLCLERMTISELESLMISCSMPVSPTNGSTGGNGSSNGKKSTLRSLLMTLSVTSLPETTTSTLEVEEAEVEEKHPKCALCKSPLAFPAYRFRLSERDSHGWFSIDSQCRERIVAVGDLYAFIRHNRRGLYSHRPMADLYCELLHYLRHIYYSRMGATSFYIRNDAEMMYTRIMRA